jgi:hypothetical protein
VTAYNIVSSNFSICIILKQISKIVWKYQMMFVSLHLDMDTENIIREIDVWIDEACG